MGVLFVWGSGYVDGGGIEVATGLQDGDGAGLSSGLAEGEGEGVSKRVGSELDLGEGVSTQVADPDGGSGEHGGERGEASVGVPEHPLSALLVMSTGVDGVSATVHCDCGQRRRRGRC